MRAESAFRALPVREILARSPSVAIADRKDEDDEGFGWSTLGEARDPARIRRGAILGAGDREA